MEHKILNFDQFMRERTNETMTVTVFGKNYEVPMKIPALVPVMMARAEFSLDAAASTQMIMRAADSMFGTEAIDEMCRNGMGAKELADLVQRIFTMISGTDADNEDEVQEVSDEDSRVTRIGDKREKK